MFVFLLFWQKYMWRLQTSEAMCGNISNRRGQWCYKALCWIADQPFSVNRLQTG